MAKRNSIQIAEDETKRMIEAVTYDESVAMRYEERQKCLIKLADFEEIEKTGKLNPFQVAIKEFTEEKIEK